jgi:asparagine synthase (glutamine-hydrolysing)
VLLGPVDRALAATADTFRADALFSGGGGDNIFCFLTTAAPVVDAWRSGNPRTALQSLRDVAELNSCTVWTAARHALRKARTPVSDKKWHTNRDFLACDPPPSDPHPWLLPPDDALPGQSEHVEGLLLIQDFLDAAERSHRYDMIYPLLAQPVVEFCLGIPSWLWVRGGRDRAVARSAFADLLPDIVLYRRTKGQLEGLCARAFAANRKQLAELLLEGRLQGAGIVDRSAIEAYLTADTVADHRYFRLFDIATLELWLQSWGRR